MKRYLPFLLLPLLALAGEGVFRRGRPETGKKPPALALLPGGPTSAQIAAGTLTGSKGETVTVTRATSKACTKADGTLTTLSSNQPCVEATGLLVEAAHTNLALQSQTFDSGTWSKNSVTVTADTTVAPDGTTTADTLTFNTAVPPGGFCDLRQAPSISAGVYTFSLWMKAGTVSSLNVRVAVSGGSGTTAFGTTLTNAWVRYSYIVTAGSGASALSIRIGNDGAGPNDLASGTVFAWGAQLVAGGLPLSYVATTSASATCNADVASMSGATLPIAKGTLFVDFTPEWSSSVALPADAIVFDSSEGLTKGILLDISNAQAAVFFAGVSSLSASQTWAQSTKYQLSLAWGSGAFTLTRDGTSIKAASAAMPSSHGTLYLGSNAGADGFANGWISNLRVYR